MPTTVCFTAGRFGDAVAARFADYLPETSIHPLVATERVASIDELVVGATFVAAALWRPYPALCDALDAACARAGVRWAAAVLDQSELWIGPIVEAPAGPCYACFRRRYLTHHDAHDRELTLQRAYDDDAQLGVAGFCDPLVAIAAAGLAEARRAPGSGLGSYRRLHVLDCTVEESRVVRVHGCPRCGRVAAGAAEDRYVRHLVPALAGVAP